MASPSNQFGFDVLGLAQFGEAAERAIPKGYAIGVFSRTFGNSLPAVTRLVNAGKCTAVRVHLTWAGSSHTYGDRQFGVYEKEAQRWNEFAKTHGNVKVYLSPFCEHNLPNPDVYLDRVKKVADRCTPVNSVYGGAFSGKYMNEVHGLGAGRPPGAEYIFSYDGDDICDSDVSSLKSKHAGAKFWFAWTANFNGKKEANEKSVFSENPAQNGRTNWPSSKLITSIDYVMSRGKNGGKLPADWFWQSHGADVGAGDSSIDKPMLVTSQKFDVVELVRGNTVVATAKRSSTPYNGRRFRFIFSKWGYELADLGGGLVDVRANGTIYGRVQPAFCQGVVPVYN